MNYRKYWAVLPVLVATVLVSIGLRDDLDQINAVMVYMLAVVLTAFFLELGPAIVTSLAGVALFDYLSLPPYMVFTRSPTDYAFMLSVMLVTAGSISLLSRRLRQQVATAHAHEARLAAAEAKEQQQQLRADLLNAISHDLRTPLASIIGAASTLLAQGDRISAANHSDLQRIILEEAQHMQGMVENLLDMARLQNPSAQPREWQALEEIVASARVILKRRLSLHTLQVDVPDSLPLLRCDAFLLERVLVNLVENAARYAPPHTEIWIRAGVCANGIELAVCDQGPGITAEDLPHVFEPFYRGGQTQSTGIGLGLTLCQKIIHAHHGEIGIDSTPGNGCRVWLRLPVAESPTLPDTPEATISVSAPLSGAPNS